MTKIKANQFFTGVGRRKSAVAQVRLLSGTGKYTLNGKEAQEPEKITEMLTLVDRSKEFDISVVTSGGGIIGQSDASSLGVARALIELNPEFKKTLRKGGFVTRDPRVKERKKPGLKRARRAPQWSKR